MDPMMRAIAIASGSALSVTVTAIATGAVNDIIPAIVTGSAIALIIDAKRGMNDLLGMTTTKATWNGYRSNAKTNRDVSIANVP